MKPGVVIVNTSRGALIDTEALIDGLKRRRIGAACLDVYEEESDLFYEDRSDSIVEDDVLVRLIAILELAAQPVNTAPSQARRSCWDCVP